MASQIARLDARGPSFDTQGVKPFTARFSRRLTFFSLAVMAFGLLLWARLILVTGRPRMAIADPDKKQKVELAAKAAAPENDEPEASAAEPPESGAPTPAQRLYP